MRPIVQQIAVQQRPGSPAVCSGSRCRARGLGVCRFTARDTASYVRWPASCSFLHASPYILRRPPVDAWLLISSPAGRAQGGSSSACLSVCLSVRLSVFSTTLVNPMLCDLDERKRPSRGVGPSSVLVHRQFGCGWSSSSNDGNSHPDADLVRPPVTHGNPGRQQTLWTTNPLATPLPSASEPSEARLGNLPCVCSLSRSSAKPTPPPLPPGT